MHYSISCPTKIFTLTIAPFLFKLPFSVNSLWYQERIFLLSLQEKEVHSSYWGHKWAHSAVHHQKDLNLCLTLNYFAEDFAESKITQTGNSTVLWCLLSDQVYITFKFQFAFASSECL